MVATDIIWDYENTDDLGIILPTEIEIPDGMTEEEEISNHLSDMTGFCHKGFKIEK